MGRASEPQKTRKALSLTIEEFSTFKQICRVVQEAWIEEHPQSKWADLNLTWGLIPEQDIQEMVRLVWIQCVQMNILRSGNNSYTIRSSIRDRLQVVRKSWYSYQKRKAERQRLSTPANDRSLSVLPPIENGRPDSQVLPGSGSPQMGQNLGASGAGAPHPPTGNESARA
ncbi:hypothetical protein Z517_09320 [Fonsecaea pedrosoi CBS 271.37]|uniref:Uncharacterized protein n=1 Tax=Fonsecaea pedrosoi CBS 271.37 TaxID=1442368 RepID=A0A0D2DGR7_9EURO|nr:uncharacterized protein Z517_09320 [Fonsecaea pedrosoi CBS 271.37]KIW76876.1 hypothetical protein Z517_09320 [Fonsecaea pedrosoi CBS 271.37]